MQYLLGSLKYRASGVTFGRGNLLHSDVVLREGHRVTIGDCCEVRQRVTLDARSDLAISIKIGSRTKIKDTVSMMSYKGKITIGEDCIVQRNTTIFGHGGVEIGDGVMIGAGVILASAKYALSSDDQPFHKQGYFAERIEISDDVFIGSGSVILAGSWVGTKVAVGANSVVSGRLERPGLYYGAPAVFRRDLATADLDVALHPTWGR